MVSRQELLGYGLLLLGGWFRVDCADGLSPGFHQLLLADDGFFHLGDLGFGRRDLIF